MTGRNGNAPLINKFEDVWVWGDPLGIASYPKGKPKSYADALIGSQWQVMRELTRKEFYRTLYLWQDMLHRRNGDIDLLHSVLKYDIEAKALGVSNVQEYIAVRIDRTRQAVSLYLQMLDMNAIQDELATNYLHNDENLPYIFDGSQSIDEWKPSEKMIRTVRVSIPRDCAGGYDGCKGNTQTGKLALCYNCHAKALTNFGSSSAFPLWLESEIQRIEREHRKQVINACYKRHYGTISIEEADSYLDAA